MLKFAGSKTNIDPLLLPSILNVNLWRLGMTLDPRCIGCRNIRKAIKNVHGKMEQDRVDVNALLNVDCVYDYPEVMEQVNKRNVHPERPLKKCTNCGDAGHTQLGYENRQGIVIAACYKTIKTLMPRS